MYEVNQWLCQFGCGKPRLGGLSVEETDNRKDAAQKVRVERGAETLSVHCIYVYVHVYTMLGWKQ